MNDNKRTRPNYAIVRENFITEKGTELVLGYIVVDEYNQQVTPINKKQVWMTKKAALESLEFLVKNMPLV